MLSDALICTFINIAIACYNRTVLFNLSPRSEYNIALSIFNFTCIFNTCFTNQSQIFLCIYSTRIYDTPMAINL